MCRFDLIFDRTSDIRPNTSERTNIQGVQTLNLTSGRIPNIKSPDDNPSAYQTIIYPERSRSLRISTCSIPSPLNICMPADTACAFLTAATLSFEYLYACRYSLRISNRATFSFEYLYACRYSLCLSNRATFSFDYLYACR